MSVNFSTFDCVIDRRGTGSLKWARYEDGDILPMWVADMDFAAPQVIVDALLRRVNDGVFGYSVATPGPVSAVVSYLEHTHGISADPSWIVWLPGMVPGLAMCAACVGNRGDSLMTFTPVYPPFLKVHRDAGRELITVPLALNEGVYSLDFAAMEAAITPHTRLILLCSPHNPVARVWMRSELEMLADFCVRHDLYLCADEIHCDLLLEPETSPHFSCLRLEGEIRRRLIVLMAASKTYNIPGMGLSFALIPDPDLRRRFQASKNTFVAEINPLSFAATEAAYSHGEQWRATLCQYLRRNRDHLTAFLATHCPVVTVSAMTATYLAWLDVRALDLAHPAAHFESHGLALNNGADFAGPGFVRLNFGCPLSTLEKGLSRFSKAVSAI